MSRNKNLDRVTKLLGARGAHLAPKADVLKGELRSDFVIDVPTPPVPIPVPRIVIVWTCTVSVGQFDQFHQFLAEHEKEIVADMNDLHIEAKYGGTYAGLPYGNPHRTYWQYPSLEAITRFKDALAENPHGCLYKNVARLSAFMGGGSIVIERSVLASTLAGYLTTLGATDPILTMLAKNGDQGA